ncbi:protein phosphatase 2C domain-containing protein [Streptomyces sp. NPDC017529]|uniref:protein phosphatase 2C domain-containing protein n=1 Tax=Streptomyces sp. NPDC017529 TaxID=3365000 RepID=UPI0037BCD77A
MDPLGDRRGHEDDWWRQLYEGDGAAVRDTGPAAAPDSLDDRVASAFRAVGPVPSDPDRWPPPGPEPDPEPMELPTADPAALDGLVTDTELDGAGYGVLTLRAASLRGETARRRAEPRGDALLTARFGAGRHALVLVAVATGAREADGTPTGAGAAHRAARDACHRIGGAVGRSYPRLAEDVRTGNRGALKSGLQRLTDRSYGKLRACAGEHGPEAGEYTAALRCLLLPADPACRTRVFFGVGAGGLFRLRNGVWQDLEPAPPAEDTSGGPVVGFGAGAPDGGAGGSLYPAEPRTWPEPFRFRASVARPGDTLLLCSAGLAEPLTGAAGFAGRLAKRWADAGPPGFAEFLGDVRLGAEGYGRDRTAVAVWEGRDAAEGAERQA